MFCWLCMAISFTLELQAILVSSIYEIVYSQSTANQEQFAECLKMWTTNPDCVWPGCTCSWPNRTSIGSTFNVLIRFVTRATKNWMWRRKQWQVSGRCKSECHFVCRCGIRVQQNWLYCLTLHVLSVCSFICFAILEVSRTKLASKCHHPSVLRTSCVSFVV